MSAISKQQIFRYAFPSRVEDLDGKQTVRLATFSNGRAANPFFFEGDLANPRRAADLLRGVMTIVKTRFHIPPAMLSRILAESDPVVTCNDNCLRFEGFSACCGVYVRADFLDAAFSGEVTGRGTTNVDFSQPMMAAIARINKNDKVSLAVGADRVVLKKMDTEVVERKVKLPVRWMKGFVEVQSVQRRMKKIHQIAGMQAFRFLRSFPKMKTHRRATYVAKSGSSLRLAQVFHKDSVRVGGLERLKVLELLAKEASSLEIYSDELTDASGWVLHFDDCRFTVVISPEVWRGFSGEGQALNDLANVDESALAVTQAQLKWQAVIDVADLAKSSKLKKPVVESALATLGTQGLVGFDLVQDAYFHREMPFDISAVEKQQPRLLAARKLIAQEKVRYGKKTKTQQEVLVKSSDVEHRVTIKTTSNETTEKCSCPWFNKHANTRGPCKHILAAQIFIEENSE